MSLYSPFWPKVHVKALMQGAFTADVKYLMLNGLIK
jgi:hypothetical protein